MFVHSVYFWLRDDLTAEQRETFLQGARSLTTIRSARYGWLGAPADTDRPIIERSYSYALTMVFDDEAAHEEYQVDEVHDRFREQCGSFWTRVLIYDSIDPEAR